MHSCSTQQRLSSRSYNQWQPYNSSSSSSIENYINHFGKHQPTPIIININTFNRSARQSASNGKNKIIFNATLRLTICECDVVWSKSLARAEAKGEMMEPIKGSNGDQTSVLTARCAVSLYHRASQTLSQLMCVLAHMFILCRFAIKTQLTIYVNDNAIYKIK